MNGEKDTLQGERKTIFFFCKYETFNYFKCDLVNLEPVHHKVKEKEMKINDRMVQWLKNVKLLQIEYENLSNLSSCNFWD